MVFEQVDTQIAPYSYRQAKDIIKIYVPLPNPSITSSQVKKTTIITKDHIQCQVVGESSPLIDIDLHAEVVPDESTFVLKPGHIVFKLKRVAEFPPTRYIFNAPIRLDENDNFLPSPAPLQGEGELLELIKSDIIQSRDRTKERIANYVDELSGIEVDPLDENSQDEDADSLYQIASTLSGDEQLKYHAHAAKLNNVKAKIACASMYERRISTEKQDPNNYVDDERTTLNEEAQQRVNNYKDLMLKYYRSAAFLNGSVAGALKLGQEAEKDENNLEAFDYYVSVILAGEEYNTFVFHFIGLLVNGPLGADQSDKSLKAIAWYKLALNRGYAPSAYDIAYIYLKGGAGVPVDYILSYGYFKLANFIDQSLPIPPEILLQLQQMRNEEEPIEEVNENELDAAIDMLDDVDEILNAALSKAVGEDLQAVDAVLFEQYQQEIDNMDLTDAQPQATEIVEPDTEEIEEIDVRQPSKPTTAINLRDFNLFDTDVIEDEVEEEQAPDVPGTSWKVAEWLLTASVFTAAGFVLFKYIRVNE